MHTPKFMAGLLAFSLHMLDVRGQGPSLASAPPRPLITVASSASLTSPTAVPTPFTVTAAWDGRKMQLPMVVFEDSTDCNSNATITSQFSADSMVFWRDAGYVTASNIGSLWIPNNNDMGLSREWHVNLRQCRKAQHGALQLVWGNPTPPGATDGDTTDPRGMGTCWMNQASGPQYLTPDDKGNLCGLAYEVATPGQGNSFTSMTVGETVVVTPPPGTT